MRPVFVTLDIVKADVPASIGMDVLDCKSRTTPETVTKRLSKRIAVKGPDHEKMYIDEWKNSMLHSDSSQAHFPVRYLADSYFCRSQLLKMNKRFFHPSTEKWFNLIKQARPDNSTKGIFATLQEIFKRYDPCENIQTDQLVSESPSELRKYHSTNPS